MPAETGKAGAEAEEEWGGWAGAEDQASKGAELAAPYSIPLLLPDLPMQINSVPSDLLLPLRLTLRGTNFPLPQ